MNQEQKRGLFQALLELLKAVFTIGSRHVEKKYDDGE